MHKEEFISRLQEWLGDEATEADALLVFRFAERNALVDSDDHGDWYWTPSALDMFGNAEGTEVDLMAVYRVAEGMELARQADVPMSAEEVEQWWSDVVNGRIAPSSSNRIYCPRQ